MTMRETDRPLENTSLPPMEMKIALGAAGDAEERREFVVPFESWQALPLQERLLLKIAETGHQGVLSQRLFEEMRTATLTYEPNTVMKEAFRSLVADELLDRTKVEGGVSLLLTASDKGYKVVEEIVQREGWQSQGL